MNIPFVVLDIWHVPTHSIPRAFFNMGLHRRPLKKNSDLKFWKLLGTGSGKTFTMRDADPHHWALLTVWDSAHEYENFSSTSVMQSWQRISDQHAHLELEPLSSKGTWAEQNPFHVDTPTRWDGATAALTRARIKPRWWISFWRSVPPVSVDLHQTPGLIASLGIGEAPVGLQGTLSVWRSNDAITQFASKQAPHRKVVERTHQTGWYAEELFARFKVLHMSGTLADVDLATATESDQQHLQQESLPQPHGDTHE